MYGILFFLIACSNLTIRNEKLLIQLIIRYLKWMLRVNSSAQWNFHQMDEWTNNDNRMTNIILTYLA